MSWVELNVSFKKPQWNLYKIDTIGAWQKYPLYEDVRFKLHSHYVFFYVKAYVRENVHSFFYIT